MKTLLLMRHAKSSWANPGTGDHDRHLNNRGRAAAPAMGRHMKNAGLIPDHVWCSTALRACETLELWSLGAKAEPEVTHTRDLYMTSAAGILEIARMTPPTHNVCMIVGHNPGMHEAAMRLAGEMAPGELYTGYPTCAVTVVEFDVDGWKEITADAGRLISFLTPRGLPD